jgi:hypothetical protein
MAHENEEIDREKALLSPSEVFDTPEDLTEYAGLSREEKIELLRRWSYDAAELSVAEEEGMGGGEPDFLARIHHCLRDLGAEVDSEALGPTKHGSVPTRPERR